MAEEWYADRLAEGMAYRVTERQRQVLDTYILGALGELRLREVATCRLDRYVRVVARNVGEPTAVIVKVVHPGIMVMAARHDAVAAKPVGDLSLRKVEKLAIRALSLGELKSMRLYAQNQLAPLTTE